MINGHAVNARVDVAEVRPLAISVCPKTQVIADRVFFRWQHFAALFSLPDSRASASETCVQRKHAIFGTLPFSTLISLLFACRHVTLTFRRTITANARGDSGFVFFCRAVLAFLVRLFFQIEKQYFHRKCHFRSDGPSNDTE
jgi:hypothetical protein